LSFLFLMGGCLAEAAGFEPACSRGNPIYQKARKAPAFRPGMDSAAARRLNAVEAVCLPIHFASQ